MLSIFAKIVIILTIASKFVLLITYCSYPIVNTRTRTTKEELPDRVYKRGYEWLLCDEFIDYVAVLAGGSLGVSREAAEACGADCE